MNKVDSSASVRNQYEAMPYPPRNPADESRRLLSTVLDSLPLINHYGYSGHQDFRNGFHALVAGGGTGDAAIFLAEQLRALHGRVSYLDVSARSMGIARERARARGLENIEWVHGSILELERLGIGPFDYINCSGVLHHLDDRDAGLAALAGVLKPDGVMGILVYSRHMRAPIYQMQELLQCVNTGVGDVQTQIRYARAVVKSLPLTNLFKAQMIRHKQELDAGDAAVYDLLLHARDEPFSVPELYEWLERAGLTLLEFASPIGQKRCYQPATFIKDEALLAQIEPLPRRERQAIADLIGLASANHAFYCAWRAIALPDPRDLGLSPFFFPATDQSEAIARELGESMETARKSDELLAIDLQFDRLEIPSDRLSEALVRLIDGRASVGELIESVARSAGTNTDEVMRAWCGLYAALNAIDWVLLRDRRIDAFDTPEALHQRVATRGQE